MKILVTFAFSCLAAMATPAVLAQSTDAATPSESRPSEQTIRTLLEVMQAKKTLQALSDQMDSMFAGMVDKQLGGQTLTPEQQKALDERRKAAASMVKELLSWESMEPLYMKVYADTFTQAELEGMIAFYSSPTGQSVIAKLPIAARNTMTEMQQRVQQMMPKLQQMAKEAAEQAKAQGPAKKAG